MKQYTYLLIDFFTVIVPFMASFHPKLMFWKNFKAFFPANIVISLAYILWDVWFTDKGVWGFNPDYLVGVYLFNLPIEEVLFFICIPYSCLFSYHCFGVWKEKNLRNYKTDLISVVLILLSVSLAGFFYDRMYPMVSFSLFAVLVAYLAFVLKPKWLGQFYLTYLIMIIPFLIVNGILTGTGLDAPIVWYNSEQIIGLRIKTIPVEDVFYGMGLIGFNLLLYEGLLAKRSAYSLNLV